MEVSPRFSADGLLYAGEAVADGAPPPHLGQEPSVDAGADGGGYSEVRPLFALEQFAPQACLNPIEWYYSNEVWIGELQGTKIWNSVISRARFS